MWKVLNKGGIEFEDLNVEGWVDEGMRKRLPVKASRSRSPAIAAARRRA